MTSPKAADFHESLVRDDDVKEASSRSVGVVFAVFFTIVGLVPLIRGGAVRPWAFVLSAIFGLLALVAPTLLDPLRRVWMLVGRVLHQVMSPVVLGMLFYVTVTPLGLLMRLLGKDPLRLHWERNSNSYWIERRPPGPPPETMVNQY